MTIREIFRELTRSEKWEILHRLMLDFQADYGKPPKDPMWRAPKEKKDHNLLTTPDHAYKCGVCGACFDIISEYDAHCHECKWKPTLPFRGGNDAD